MLLGPGSRLMWAKDRAYFHIFSFKLSKNDANSTVPFKTVLRPYKVLRLMYVSWFIVDMQKITWWIVSKTTNFIVICSITIDLSRRKPMVFANCSQCRCTLLCLVLFMPRLKAIPSPRFMHFHLSQFKGERDSSCYNVYELFIR